jgi:hypothetical protein
MAAHAGPAAICLAGIDVFLTAQLPNHLQLSHLRFSLRPNRELKTLHNKSPKFENSFYNISTIADMPMDFAC